MNDFFTALVLAGSRTEEIDLVARYTKKSAKAYADINGTAMIEHVVSALQSSGAIKNIVLCLKENPFLDQEAPALYQGLINKTMSRIEPDRSPVRSLLKAIQNQDLTFPVLITTADHALLSEKIIIQFINGYNPDEFNAAVALLPLRVLAARYPDIRRTKLNFKDGGFKGCNLFIFKDRSTALKILNFWQNLEAQRKKPWRMAHSLGVMALARYLTKQMSLQEAVSLINLKTKTKIQPVMLDQPHAALDVDSPTDLDFIRMIKNLEGNFKS